MERDASIKELKEEVSQLKSTETAIILYESKFQEIKAKNQKMKTTLKQNSDVIEEQKIAIQELKQQIEDKDEVDAKKDAEIFKINQEKEELARLLAKVQKMLAQSSSHQVMKQEIDMEDKNARGAEFKN